MNKSLLREELFKLLYSLEVQKCVDSSQISVFFENTNIKEKDKEVIEEDVVKIIELDPELKSQITKNLKSDWKLERISKINMTILRIAIYEILYKKLPYKIVINEAVELAKKYGEETSASFVNGILASIVKENNIAE